MPALLEEPLEQLRAGTLYDGSIGPRLLPWDEHRKALFTADQLHALESGNQVILRDEFAYNLMPDFDDPTEIGAGEIASYLRGRTATIFQCTHCGRLDIPFGCLCGTHAPVRIWRRLGLWIPGRV